MKEVGKMINAMEKVYIYIYIYGLIMYHKYIYIFFFELKGVQCKKIRVYRAAAFSRW